MGGVRRSLHVFTFNVSRFIKATYNRVAQR